MATEMFVCSKNHRPVVYIPHCSGCPVCAALNMRDALKLTQARIKGALTLLPEPVTETGAANADSSGD